MARRAAEWRDPSSALGVRTFMLAPSLDGSDEQPPASLKKLSCMYIMTYNAPYKVQYG